ncbi:hypothetical protein RFI_27520 [Reticulomyxa filosa]|uniref:Uncharacterized protein n=1 Tax=Reticulomyxa filosa TaxID=46433 RepID=X6MA25_RETFI|nr:hypothetical protein RFI_27520 [Reticulomyxa filosa]|eukprot:ETO09855.1 hypothetical protein RFI_27520 [Reticulomyxa filosa]
MENGKISKLYLIINIEQLCCQKLMKIKIKKRLQIESLQIESLQIGNPNKSSLEFNVHIQWYNDFNDVDSAHVKWACLILNNSWYFRTINHYDRADLSNCFSVKKRILIINIFVIKIMESICSEKTDIIWNDRSRQINKDSLNPYSISLKQVLHHCKVKLQMRDQFIQGTDELIYFECAFDKSEPPIPKAISDKDILLHNIYKHLPHYPIIQVYWKIKGRFVVPYKHTIDIERITLPKSGELGVEITRSNKKSTFNPFLYECNLHKIKLIKDTLHLKITRNNELHKLLHEMIQNGYLCDLMTYQHTNNKQEKKQLYDNIKQQISFNEANPCELVLNDKTLTILNELKILYHDDIHKQMGYPLQLHHICAVLLYCGRSCNAEFSYDQIQFRHHRWPYLDDYLQGSIMILHKHERREESEMELYCGLKSVRLENIKEIKAGYFISHVSTSDDVQVAEMYRSDQGCILHFHPSMRRSSGIHSCDVSWISPFKHERAILFSRSAVSFDMNEKTNKTLFAWNAKVESEDEYTQMILLTWVRYDQFIQQTMHISAMWNHSIDLNVIYIALRWFKQDVNKIMGLLFEFEDWKSKHNNEQIYKDRVNEFMERRCCNHNVNLFFMFLSMWTCDSTVHNGLPFVEKDKNMDKKR